MARAKALCMCKTCGYEFKHIAYRGNSKDARSYEKWASENIDECPSCREERIKAEREKEAEEAAEAAKSKGWPELTGTEKQINWAVRIREEGLGAIIEKNEKHNKKGGASYRLVEAAVNTMLNKYKRASWWIDNRNNIYSTFIDTTTDNPQAQEESPEIHSDDAVIAKPQEQAHDGVADIEVSEKCVSASYQKDDDFRKVVKGLGYRWIDGAWRMSIDFSTGNAAERAAELGNKLLNAGFAIRIQDPDTLKRAIAGEYEPMTYRWVSKSPKTGKFVISWGKEDDLYSKAKKLPGARYVSPSIHVPAKEWVSVMDFAETYDFKFSPGAQEMISEMQGATVTVTPAASKNARYDERPLEDVLNSSRDIIEDLKDEINN